MTADLIVSLDEILAARERIAGHVHRTPMLSSSTAARFIAAAGGPRLADERLYLKAENLQKTGSFKARGMTNRIATLEPEQRARGAITMSAGNAGQAFAWAATEAGVPMVTVMAETANPLKVEACRDYGAEVVLEGDARRRRLPGPGADPRRARPRVHPPLRRPDGDRGPRHGRARDSRGRARTSTSSSSGSAAAG